MSNQIREAYARLVALKTNLPRSIDVDKKFITEFSEILDLLESASGGSLNGFRVSEPDCTRSYLMMKVDAVRSFFTIGQQKEDIGFKFK